MPNDGLNTVSTPTVSENTTNSFFQNHWLEGSLILGFWLTVSLLLLGQEVLEPHRGDQGLREGQALFSVLKILIWALVTPVVFWIVPYISPEKIGWLRTLLVTIVLGVVVAVITDLIDHFLWNTLVNDGRPRPMSILFILDRFHFLNEFFIYVAVLAAGFARSFFVRVQEQREEAIQLRMDTARLQTNLAEARLSALRMQINPHFLFNTLHVISDHFEENPRAARRMIARLSEIMRYTFEGTETREVPLHQEMHFLEGYLDIQRFRFEDRLEVNAEIDPDVSNALVPTLILQPLVENAIKHGISQIEEKGVISIIAKKKDDFLLLRVVDNGPGKTLVKGKNNANGGIGLKNTRERLNMLYGDNQQFTIETPDAGGFTVEICLPFHTDTDVFLSAVSP